MALSRTSRILIGFVLLAASMFIWYNFLNQTTSVGTLGFPAISFGRPAATLPSAALPQDALDGTPVPVAVAPTGPGVVPRDLVVADLPFLVTEPPPPVNSPGSDGGNGSLTSRPSNTTRATVNPFSPILVRTAASLTPVIADSAPTDNSSTQVVEVPIPAAPTPKSPPVVSGTVSQVVAPPTPQALTPPAPRARNLPRSLPRGTLPVVPGILRSSRSPAPLTTPALAEVAVIREPSGSAPALKGMDSTSRPLASDPPPNPIQLSMAVAAASAPNSIAANSDYRDPLAVGATALSRYLRDNNFSFTGSVLGPVSVGVFRSALNDTPIVISLGQTLPDTEIVLTDLKGQQAELTLDDTSQILTLDLRR